jgi:hypothetical protein
LKAAPDVGRTWCGGGRPRVATAPAKPRSSRLDTFHPVILDDITCGQKDQAETSVLFERVARGCETGSLAGAAIDRLVDHATILELPEPAAVAGRRRGVAVETHVPGR